MNSNDNTVSQQESFALLSSSGDESLMSTTPDSSEFGDTENLSTPDISTIDDTDWDQQTSDDDNHEGFASPNPQVLELNYNLQFPDMSETVSKLSPPPAKSSAPAPNPEDSFRDYYETYSSEYIEFMTHQPTTNHTVTHFKSVLKNNGFTYLPDTQPIRDLSPGFYFTSKDDQSLIAFIVGGTWHPENGSCFIGSHCDAITLKVNPRGLLREKVDGYELLGVAPYSGPFNSLWLNRDLGLAGSILIRDEHTGKISRKLVNSYPDPVAFIPQLAPHFGLEKDEYNPQTQMVPICGFSAEDDAELVPTEEEKNSKFYKRHSLCLLRYVATLAKTPLSSIVDFDLELIDIQPSHRGGLSNEFIYLSRLDDRLCAFSSVYGLIEFSQRFYLDKDIQSYDGLVGVYLANHEEIGSGSRTGAKGGFLIDVLRSLVSDKVRWNAPESVANLTTNTVFLSTDVTHALNPNFKNVYLDKNFPLPNTGPSIKFDSNFHVLSDSLANEFLTRIIDDLSGIKLQHFHIRNDSRSGGTIGPIMSDSQRGINGAKLIIDVGLPILSMHSIRGIAGYKDVGMGVRFFKEVLEKWKKTIDEMEYGK
ncbi:Vacuolar aminopeptidase 1 [Candida viswanathii]|uniref:Vacuolar aminopeptidase 1 n=1 Tax=Candida viswanathii TaxID=5486 RepID=A0A367YGB3_9ASCO|nr:Vacuolar aminopeptidase 1 [Candida viswanathii]